VNNVYVSAVNHDFCGSQYLRSIPAELVREIHLAGHTARQIGKRWILIDDHGSRVSDPVWALYRQALERFPGLPTLIEWDSQIPALAVLIEQAATAQSLCEEASSAVSA
jgi:uncharacterized protein (UPF0276 family)